VNPARCECPVGSKHGKTVRCGKTPVERWVIPPYKRQPRRTEWRCPKHQPKRGMRLAAVLANLPDAPAAALLALDRMIAHETRRL